MPKMTNTKVMLKTINQRKRPGKFLLDTFFSKHETHKAEEMEFDVKSGKRKMAPFVSPIVGGVVVARDGYETRKFTTPKIAPERITTVGDATKIGLGENEFSTKSAAQRQQELLVYDLVELDDMIVRREEWMAREAILTKSVNIKGKGVEQNVKFDIDDTLILSAEELWSAEGSDPLELLKTEQRKIVQATGIKPNLVIFEGSSYDAFTKNATVVKAFEKNEIKLGTLEPMLKDNNITFIGKIIALGLELYAYDEWFIDDSENEVPYLPSGTVILGSRDVGKMHYGAVKQMEKGEFVEIEAERVPKYIINEDDEITKLRLSSRPLPVPYDTKSWRVFKVL